jgi:NADH pyrophosphatase NudC (nudix superfamily)
LQIRDCSAQINYTDAIMRDVLTRGIVDPDLLGNKNQNMALEEVIQFVEAKEAGKQSASRLLDSPSVEAASSYKRSKQALSKDNQDLCSYCGKRGHGKKSVAQLRKTQCPAYGHRCELCHRDHHFENVCRSKDNPKQQTLSRQHNLDKESTLCTLAPLNHSMTI